MNLKKLLQQTKVAVDALNKVGKAITTKLLDSVADNVSNAQTLKAPAGQKPSSFRLGDIFSEEESKPLWDDGPKMYGAGGAGVYIGDVKVDPDTLEPL